MYKRNIEDELNPFHIKSQETFSNLLLEMGFNVRFILEMNERYSEVTIEDTLKILCRCKKIFNSRPKIIDVINLLPNFDELLLRFKNLVDKYSDYVVTEDDLNMIQDYSMDVTEYGYKVLCEMK